jgi:hypothetical protein
MITINEDHPEDGEPGIFYTDGTGTHVLIMPDDANTLFVLSHNGTAPDWLSSEECAT